MEKKLIMPKLHPEMKEGDTVAVETPVAILVS